MFGLVFINAGFGFFGVIIIRLMISYVHDKVMMGELLME
jgi:hypothetical protein